MFPSHSESLVTDLQDSMGALLWGMLPFSLQQKLAYGAVSPFPFPPHAPYGGPLVGNAPPFFATEAGIRRCLLSHPESLVTDLQDNMGALLWGMLPFSLQRKLAYGAVSLFPFPPHVPVRPLRISFGFRGSNEPAGNEFVRNDTCADMIETTVSRKRTCMPVTCLGATCARVGCSSQPNHAVKWKGNECCARPSLHNQKAACMNGTAKVIVSAMVEEHITHEDTGASGEGVEEIRQLFG